ncbi:MAG TPA: ribosome maturation factor RimP [Steroidobacteraceae bacterium]|jgi:ribosome maturation factor RimP|nr:ribosome maturation factor RimP [Steroidobacteraceae bacterium]
MATVLRGRLIALIEPLLTGLGYELVELEYAPSRSNALLRIFIDRLRPEGALPGDEANDDANKNATVALDSEGRVALGDETSLRESGIGIDDCERVSHEVSALLDVEDPIPTAYTLEVSSPGSDRVLRTRAHFVRFAGARVHVELKAARAGRRRYTGTLKSVSDAGIELEVDRQPVSVPFDEIEKARLAPEAPAPMRR